MTLAELNQKYTQTCAELGDLVYGLLDLRDQRNQLEDQINEREKKVTAYRDVRADLQRALAALQAPVMDEYSAASETVETEPA